MIGGEEPSILVHLRFHLVLSTSRGHRISMEVALLEGELGQGLQQLVVSLLNTLKEGDQYQVTDKIK